MVTTSEFGELIEVLRDFIRSEVMPAEAGIDESDEIPGRLDHAGQGDGPVRLRAAE